MRSLLTWPMALLAVLFLGMTVQQWQLIRLRGLLAGQAASLDESRQHVADLTAQLTTADAARARAYAQNQFRRQAGDGAFWREDERRLMLSSYEGFLARMNLPPAQLARLKDLLVERAEAVFDAKDAAEQEGIAAGTLEMQRAMAFATADLDHEITGLLGPPSVDRTQELAALAAQNEAVAAAAEPAWAEAPLAAPDYAYAPAPIAAAPDYSAWQSSPAVYVPVEGVLYGVRREDRFRERPQEGRRLFEVPRAAGMPPALGHSVVRSAPPRTEPVRTAPVH